MNVGGAAARAIREVDVIVVGAGVAGSTLANDLALAGKTVHVVEKYGATATRRNLFNLAPAVGDRLAALDKGTGELTDILVPIQQFRFDDRVIGGTPRIRAGTDFLHEQVSRPGVRGLMDGLVAPPEDPRLWSRARIEEVENGLRNFAVKHHADKVTFSFDSQLTKIQGVTIPGADSAANPVGGLQSAANGVLELLPKNLDHVDVVVKGSNGVEQAVRGKFLVYATGGRNPLGLKPELSKDVMHFVGGEYPATTTKPVVAERIREWSDKIPGEVGASLVGERMPLTTIGLTYPKGRSIVWAQMAHDPKSVDPKQLKEILAERSRFVGMEGNLLGEPIPVRVQLGSLSRAAFPEQRIMLIGDELGPPYFPTSSGAAKSIAVSAPLAADALTEALKPGADVAKVLGKYERDALDAHKTIGKLSETQVTHDLHALGTEMPFDLPRTRVTG